MPEKPNFRLSQLHGRLGDLVYQFTKVQFAQAPAPESWCPSVNAYRCPAGFAICVELAGVQKDGIHVEVHGRTVRIQGRRETPEPKEKGEEPTQIVAMEIDAGPFSREVKLPVEVEPDSVRAEYKEGMLWIYLPERAQG